MIRFGRWHKVEEGEQKGTFFDLAGEINRRPLFLTLLETTRKSGAGGVGWNLGGLVSCTRSIPLFFRVENFRRGGSFMSFTNCITSFL